MNLVVGCAICHESFNDKEPCALGICGHAFDDRCIREWLQREGNCPICRRPMASYNMQKVHFSLVPDTLPSTNQAVLPVNNNEDACTTIDSLTTQLEEAEMRVVISQSAIEDLQSQLEAMDIEKT